MLRVATSRWELCHKFQLLLLYLDIKITTARKKYYEGERNKKIEIKEERERD